MLLVGVQGCGKSLAAKAIARDWQLPAARLDAGRLYDKYVGESEENMRRAIATAEAIAPVVLWIDEIEKAFAPGGRRRRRRALAAACFGTFLTWLQEKRRRVFVVATANDCRALPPELLRKGRFDEIFFVDLPDADGARGRSSRIHLRQRRQDPAALRPRAQLAAASEGFSGAEIEQAVIASLLRCAAREARRSTTEPVVCASWPRRCRCRAHARRGRGASARAGAGALRAGPLTRSRAMVASASRQRTDSSA